MSNMSHCRFENTARDLENCYEALGNGVRKEDLSSEYEEKAYDKLIQLCVDIACDFGNCVKE